MDFLWGKKGDTMKNKYLIIVSVPMLEKEFNIYIPIVKKVGIIKNLIINVVEENSDGNFVNDGCKHLYYKSTGEQLDDNQYVKYSDIQSGTRLILY